MVNESEEKIVQYISKRIIGRLLGEGSEFDKLYVKPSKRFFVGKLLPPEQENKWKSIINPSAMGVEFTLHAIDKITVKISFDIYYRAYPSYNEQIGIKDDEPSSTDPLIKVYKRATFTAKATIDLLNEKGASLKKYYKLDYDTFIETIRRDPALFKNKGSAIWSPSVIENEDAYNAYLSKRNGNFLLPWDFDLILERSDKVLKLTLANTSESKKNR